MDRKKADRIIVTSNSRMQMVIDWYFENKSWLNKEEFHAPMKSGVIELREENIEMTFEVKSDLAVEISIIPTTVPNLQPFVTFDYNPQTDINTNYRVAPFLSQESRNVLRMILTADQTDKKEALKYRALMLFMTHYREIVEVKERVVNPPAKRRKGKNKKKHSGPRPLIRKSYVITEFIKDALPKPKRKYTKPEHEVNVRGFIRHYKNGKTTWVSPSVRYKGKNTKPKEYQL